MKSLKILILIIIFLLGVAIYFYKLDNIPPALYIDEAAPVYNAYSLLLTGKDEYGKSVPLLFRSAGLYAVPLYTYLTILPVSIFGLNIFSARFISVISGLLSGVVIYLFLKNSNIYKHTTTPYLGLMLFLITPWIYFYSRIGYEISLGFLLFSLGSYLLWLSSKSNKFLMPSFIILSISIYAAPFNKIIIPLIIFVYILFIRKINFKYLLLSLIVFLVIQLPNFSIIKTPAFLAKSDLFYKEAVFTQAEKINIFLPDSLSIPLSFSREFFSRYFSYFSPKSLFFLPDPDLQRSVPELSVFYFWMIVPYFIGLYILFLKRKEKFSKFLIMLLLITPIPASLTRDPFSTHRAIPLLLPLFLVIMLGIEYLISKFSTKIWFPVFILVFMVSFVTLWRSYFVLFPKERAKVWGYGFSQLAEIIKSRPNTKFVIDQSRIKPAYIYLAFYLKLHPKEIQTFVDPSVKDNYYTNTEFNSYYKLANFESRNIKWEEDIYEEHILVGDELTISESQAKEHFLTKVFEIRDPIDFLVFQGYQTNPKEKCINIQYKNVNCKV